MNKMMSDTAIFEISDNFRLKLRVEGSEGNSGCCRIYPRFFMCHFRSHALPAFCSIIVVFRRLKVGDLPEQSYEGLIRKASSIVAPESLGQLSYKDMDGHITAIGSTCELVYAVEDNLQNGFVVIDVASPALRHTMAVPTPPVPAAAQAPFAHITAAQAAAPAIRRPIAITPVQDRKRKATESGDARPNTASKRQTSRRKKKPSKKKEEADAALVVPPEILSSDPVASDTIALVGDPGAGASAPAVKPSILDIVQVKILNALLELHALDIVPAPKIHVALLTGYSNMGSKGFAGALKFLKKNGDVIASRKTGTLYLSAKALQKLPPITPVANNAEFQMRLRVVLTGKRGKNRKVGYSKTEQIFQYLTDGKVHSREEVASAHGYSNLQSKGFTNAISQLDSLRLVDKKKKDLQLKDIAFPFGRPA
jgi:hypothetical protein